MPIYSIIFFILSIIAVIFCTTLVVIVFFLYKKYQDNLLLEYLILTLLLIIGFIHEPLVFFIKNDFHLFIVHNFYSLTICMFCWRLLVFIFALINEHLSKKNIIIIGISSLISWMFINIISSFNESKMVIYTDIFFYIILASSLLFLNKKKAQIKMITVLKNTNITIKLIIVYLPIFITELLSLAFLSKSFKLINYSIPYILFIMVWSFFNLSLIYKYFFKPVKNNNKNKIELYNLSEFGITRTELEIVKLIKNGLSNKEIAYERNIKEKTVKNHIYNIYLKLQINSRVELINFIYSNY